jgi:hypothetical protein
MAVSVSSFKVCPKFGQESSGGFDLYWTINGATFPPTFQVSIADTESGPWTPLLVTKTTDLFLLGAGTQRLNMQPALTWFKLGVYDGATLKIESRAMDSRNGMSRQQYLRYREILRRHRLYFDKGPVNPGFLVRRKIYGTKCNVCMDPILSSPASSECGTCYGTGIIGGYFTPVRMTADWAAGVVPRVSNTSKESPGPQQIQKTSIRIFGYPDAKSEDLWFDLGTRFFYLVETVTPEQWVGSVLTQSLAISKLPSHHQVYKLSVPLS